MKLDPRMVRWSVVRLGRTLEETAKLGEIRWDGGEVGADSIQAVTTKRTRFA